MKLFQRFWFFGFVAFCLAPAVSAQWQNGNLALRTNGNTFQSGDQLRVELIALEGITESFSAQVVYGFTETVQEKDDDGNATTKQVDRLRKREGGPTIENFGKFQTLLLDDRYHFGDASPGGWYEVRVELFQPYTRKPITTLRTCVFYQNANSEGQSNSACTLYLRGIKRVNHKLFWTFDGRFTQNARFSVLLLRGSKVLKHLTAGAYSSGAREFSISSPELEGTAGQTFDILVHDHLSGLSSTLMNVTIPEVE
jgi:hypothetical protein